MLETYPRIGNLGKPPQTMTVSFGLCVNSLYTEVGCALPGAEITRMDEAWAGATAAVTGQAMMDWPQA